MIILVVLALVGQLDTRPFHDEEAAARAFEIHLNCLASAAYERRDDAREAAAVAVEVISSCRDQAATLRNALADVYRRRPERMQQGQQPEAAADLYIATMNARAEPTIREGRKHR